MHTTANTVNAAQVSASTTSVLTSRVCEITLLDQSVSATYSYLPADNSHVWAMWRNVVNLHQIAASAPPVIVANGPAAVIAQADKCKPDDLELYFSGHSGKVLVKLAGQTWYPVTRGVAATTLHERCGLSLNPPAAGLQHEAALYIATITSNPARFVEGYGYASGMAAGLYSSDGLVYLVLKTTPAKDGRVVLTNWNGAKPDWTRMPAAVAAPVEAVEEPQEIVPEIVLPAPLPPEEAAQPLPAVDQVEIVPKSFLHPGDMDILASLTCLRTECPVEHHHVQSAEQWLDKLLTSCDFNRVKYGHLTARTLSSAMVRLSRALSEDKISNVRLGTGHRRWRILMPADLSMGPLSVFRSRVNDV